MTFVAGTVRDKICGMQEGGFRLVQFRAQFTTTNASGDIDCKLGTVLGYHVDTMGARNTDEQIYLDETPLADGSIRKPADGRLTFTRTGTKTSGLWICGAYWGF